MPAPTRSLRNEIARHLIEGHDWTAEQMRSKLEDAAVAVEALQAFTLVFGPQALLDAVGGAS